MNNILLLRDNVGNAIVNLNAFITKLIHAHFGNSQMRKNDTSAATVISILSSPRLNANERDGCNLKGTMITYGDTCLRRGAFLHDKSSRTKAETRDDRAQLTATAIAMPILSPGGYK